MLNMSSHLLASILVFVFVLAFSVKNKFKFDILDFTAMLFLLFFNLSFFYTTVPYGFKEFSTFNAGIMTFLVTRNLKSFSPQFMISAYTALVIFVVFGIYDLLASPLDRLAGFFKGDEPYINYPNAAADLFLFFIPTLLALGLYKKNKNKIIFTILSLLTLAGFWLTLSRGAVLALAVSIGVLFAYELIAEKGFKKFIHKILHLSCTILLSGFLAFGIYLFDPNPLDISNRITNTDISAGQSTDERLLLFNGALQIIKNNPFGIGPGGFADANPPYQVTPLVNSEHPHNLFLKLASESGVHTALFFALFLLLAIYTSLKNLSFFEQKLDRTIFFSVFAGFVGVLAHQLVDYNLNFAIIYLLFFGILGYLTSYRFGLPKIKASKPFTLLVIIITALFLIISLLQLRGYAYLKKYTPAYQSTQSAVTAEKMADLLPFVKLPFKQHYFEVLASNPDNLGRFRFLAQNFVVQYPNHYHTAVIAYHLGQAPITDALKLNPKNDLNLHYELIFHSVNRQLYADDYLELLTSYNSLIAVNAHNIIATLDKDLVLSIYDSFPNIQEFQDARQKFSETYDLELQKFNCRFYNETFNRNN